MTNVYTRKYHRPRTTTLLDYRTFQIDASNKLGQRVLSPTRRGNPHPVGLNHQNIPSTSSYLIWHPDFSRKTERYPEMVNHTKHVNFSCQHQILVADDHKKKGHAELPKIQFTENTTSRQSYINPSRFPELMSSSKLPSMTRPVTGIVPNLIVPQYLPVIEK